MPDLQAYYRAALSVAKSVTRLSFRLSFLYCQYIRSLHTLITSVNSGFGPVGYFYWHRCPSVTVWKHCRGWKCCWRQRCLCTGWTALCRTCPSLPKHSAVLATPRWIRQTDAHSGELNADARITVSHCYMLLSTYCLISSHIVYAIASSHCITYSKLLTMPNLWFRLH